MFMKSTQKTETRRKLIEAALNLSAESGFSSLSLREVTKQAGITPTAFYRHFHDMEELGLALIDEVGLSLRSLLRNARKKVDIKESVIRTSVETFTDYVVENANLFRLLQGEKQGASPAFRKALFAELGRFIEEMSEDLKRIQLQLNQPIRDVDLAAEMIVAVAFTVGGEVLDLPKHKRQDIVERLVRMIKVIIKGSLDQTVKTTVKKKKTTSK
jgi:AcrR family transcriptional regulator